MQSLLTWVGSKRWQVPALLNVWNKEHIGRRLVEPFCGGCNVAFGLNPNTALLNDANPHLINFWRCVQRGVPIPIRTGMKPELYLQYRDEFNALIDRGAANTDAAAQLFYALNHWCFNGLWRVNVRGLFNVAPRPRPKPLPTYDVANYKGVMTWWIFTAGHWRDLEVEDDDFIYADPPYDGGFTQYTCNSFTWDDQVELAVRLSTHPGPVVLMNKSTERVLKLYDSLGFTVTLLDVQQAMSRCKARKGTVLEVMATNRTLDPRDIMEIK